MDAQEETQAQLAAKGVATAFAAGSLLYISLAEMVGGYFSDADVLDSPKLIILMVLSFAVGCTFMAVIAFWG